MNTFGVVVLLVFGVCTTVSLVAVAKDWDPSHIRLDWSGSLRARRRELRYGSWVRGLVWPPFYVAVAFGAIFGVPLLLAWTAVQAVARWVLAPRWEPVVALAMLGAGLWLLSRCSN